MNYPCRDKGKKALSHEILLAINPQLDLRSQIMKVLSARAEKTDNLIPIVCMRIRAARVFLLRGPEPYAFHIEGSFNNFTVQIHQTSASLL